MISKYRFSSQSVTASSHWRHSHSRVAAKWSTNSDPNQSRAKGGGAVVHAPGRLYRRPESVHQALVRIHGRPEHRTELEHVCELPREIALEELRHAAVATLRIEEEVLLAVGEALVDVARAPRVLRVPLRHERRHDPEARADLLRRGLEKERAITRLERLGKEDGYF